MTSYYLPTLDRLDAAVPSNLDAHKVASEWFTRFSSSLESIDFDTTMSLLVEDSFWRDILSLTWDFRTIYGSAKIRQLLEDRVPDAKLTAFKLDSAEFSRVCPDMVWIEGLFTFEVGQFGGIGGGVFRLVPTSTGEWKAHHVYTNLESLKDFPDKIGSLRDPYPNHGKWEEKRRAELAFEDVEPYVLVIGGGHAGLETAARLKFADVPTLVIEKAARIGDTWRERYDVLCLNDPVWCDHMPYIPFPPSWPTYSPAKKLADWLESYANTLELNVWLSTTVTYVRKDSKTGTWDVIVRRGDYERVFHPVHVIFAVGLMSPPYIPSIPNQDEFKGTVIHSSRFKSARNYPGKKVVVVGTGPSGHDISSDCVQHGVDVTMYQRSSVYVMSAKEGFPRLLGPYREGGPPVEIADRTRAASPVAFLVLLTQRVTKIIAEADKELLSGLAKRGFKLNLGLDDSGILLLSTDRPGGYYVDQGASKLIVDGKIKLKADSTLQRFTENGLKFEDGSKLDADVVVFATGYTNMRESIRKICGDEITNQLKELGGIDEEYELNSVYRDCGVENLWFATGTLAVARHHTRHLALQIKAIKEGFFGDRYSL